jgi:hypothetical protein
VEASLFLGAKNSHNAPAKKRLRKNPNALTLFTLAKSPMCPPHKWLRGHLAPLWVSGQPWCRPPRRLPAMYTFLAAPGFDEDTCIIRGSSPPPTTISPPPWMSVATFLAFILASSPCRATLLEEFIALEVYSVVFAGPRLAAWIHSIAGHSSSFTNIQYHSNVDG